MGIKSRSNWNIPWCSETDCTNRGDKCAECYRKCLKNVRKGGYKASEGVGVGLGIDVINDASKAQREYIDSVLRNKQKEK